MAGETENTINSLLKKSDKERLLNTVTPIVGEKSWYGDWLGDFTEAGKIARIHAYIDENNFIPESIEPLLRHIAAIHGEKIENQEKIKKIQALLTIHSNIGKLYFEVQNLAEFFKKGGKQDEDIPMVQTVLQSLSRLGGVMSVQEGEKNLLEIGKQVEGLRKAAKIVTQLTYTSQYFGKEVSGIVSLKKALLQKIQKGDQNLSLEYFEEKNELYQQLQKLSISYERLKGSFGEQEKNDVSAFIKYLGNSHTHITPENIAKLQEFLSQESYRRHTVETVVYNNALIDGEFQSLNDLFTYLKLNKAQTQEPYKKFFSYFTVLLQKKLVGKSTQEVINENRSRNGNRQETGGLNLTVEEVYALVDEVAEILANNMEADEEFSKKFYLDLKGIGKVEISERLKQKVLTSSKDFLSLSTGIELIYHPDFPKMSSMGGDNVQLLQKALGIGRLNQEKLEKVSSIVSSEQNSSMDAILQKIERLIKSNSLSREQFFYLIQSFIVPGNKQSLTFLKKCTQKGIIPKMWALQLIEGSTGLKSDIKESVNLSHIIDENEGIGIPENALQLTARLVGKEKLSKTEVHNLTIFLKLFLQIESSGGLNVRHYKKQSSAAGYFQYLTKNGEYKANEKGEKQRYTSSYETGLRAIPQEYLGSGKLLADYTLMTKTKWNIPLKNPEVTLLSAEEQMILFLSDICKKDATSMKKIILTGESKSMVQVYAKIHNTAPDEATLGLIKKSSDLVLKEKNKSGFSIIEVVIAASILSITVFGVYKLISENSKLIANKDIYTQKNILLHDIKECIEVLDFSTFFSGVQTDYSFNFGPLNSSCISDTYNANYSFPSVDIGGKSYFLYGKIISKSTTKIDWEIGVYEEATGKVSNLYTQLP